MTQTNYDQGYFNGDIGTISSFCEGILSVTFFDKVLSLSRDDFANMQLAYSITVHKSQGSEIDDVHIILPDSCKNMLTRRIVYTAITRAKSHVYIYSVGDAFEYAVKNKAEHQRRSNLVYRIQNG
jgi:exodeoxyribonuclease V alpha subunit